MNDNFKKAIVVVGLILLGTGLYIAKHNDSQPMSMGMVMPAPKTSGSSKSNGVQATNMITYKGFDVVQKHIRIKKGTTVTWTNQDAANHDVTPDTETADFKASKLFGKGKTYSHTFNTVGTFSYHCSPHPYMKGTIEVTE